MMGEKVRGKHVNLGNRPRIAFRKTKVAENIRAHATKDKSALAQPTA